MWPYGLRRDDVPLKNIEIKPANARPIKRMHKKRARREARACCA
jgi:hypothetical protein